MVKASDIDTWRLLEIIRECNEARCNYPMDAGWHGGRPGYGYDLSKVIGHTASRYDLQKSHYPDIPEKVLLAKLRGLTKSGLLSGCACGCRGDFELIIACKWPKPPPDQGGSIMLSLACNGAYAPL